MLFREHFNTLKVDFITAILVANYFKNIEVKDKWKLR
jgi:hypothetical protein